MKIFMTVDTAFEVWDAARFFSFAVTRGYLHITLTRHRPQTTGALCPSHLLPGGVAPPPRQHGVLSET